MSGRAGRRAERCDRRWRAAYNFLAKRIFRHYNFEADLCRESGACIVAANRVTAADPLLLAMSFPERCVRFMSRENILGSRFLTLIFNLLFGFFSVREKSGDTGVIKQCLQSARDGGIAVIFPEGGATWNGVSGRISPAAGKMLRASGAKLITYRLEGGYFAFPRWSKEPRGGKIRGRIVGVYEPEMLKSMNTDEINRLISRDIYEDAWARQDDNAGLHSKKPAKGIEKALFLCPKCGCVGTLKGAGDKIVCTCGMEVGLNVNGRLDPAEPFRNLLQWDMWQAERLRSGKFRHGDALFSDNDVSLRRVSGGRAKTVCRGTLTQYADRLDMAGRVFKISDIKSMTMPENNAIIFNVDKECYKIRAQDECCLRKYLTVLENAARERDAALK